MHLKKQHINRRSFVGKSVKAATLLSIAPTFALAATKQPEKKLKLVLVGTGIRGVHSWGIDLVEPYSDYVEMVGLCDSNKKRVEVAKEMIGTNAKTYHSSKFDLMLREQKPDFVIVTTTDNVHVDYIVRAMELGCNVISEKPIATDELQCQRILEAEKKSGKKIYVGFNVRYMNESIEMKKIIGAGEIGKIISIEYQEYLNTDHGASYFRRWHGKTKYSGSLFVHKSSHHFDLINWILDADPVEVRAMGALAFYGANKKFAGKNCRNCNFTNSCEFYWDITKKSMLKKLYVDCETIDNYYRDGCVWDAKIDSPDSGSVLVQYDNGTQLNYSLNAYLPYEGQKISFSGDKGRLDVRLYYNQPWLDHTKIEFRLTKNRKTTKNWEIFPDRGNHSGADNKIKDDFFKPGQKFFFKQRAGSRAGVLSSLIGIAALKSIKTGNSVKIKDLIKL